MTVKITNLADDNRYIYSAHYFNNSPTFAIDIASENEVKDITSILNSASSIYDTISDTVNSASINLFTNYQITGGKSGFYQNLINNIPHTRSFIFNSREYGPFLPSLYEVKSNPWSITEFEVVTTPDPAKFEDNIYIKTTNSARAASVLSYTIQRQQEAYNLLGNSHPQFAFANCFFARDRKLIYSDFISPSGANRLNKLEALAYYEAIKYVNVMSNLRVWNAYGANARDPEKSTSIVFLNSNNISYTNIIKNSDNTIDIPLNFNMYLDTRPLDYLSMNTSFLRSLNDMQEYINATSLSSTGMPNNYLGETQNNNNYQIWQYQSHTLSLGIKTGDKLSIPMDAIIPAGGFPIDNIISFDVRLSYNSFFDCVSRQIIFVVTRIEASPCLVSTEDLKNPEDYDDQWPRQRMDGDSFVSVATNKIFSSLPVISSRSPNLTTIDTYYTFSVPNPKRGVADNKQIILKSNNYIDNFPDFISPIKENKYVRLNEEYIDEFKFDTDIEILPVLETSRVISESNSGLNKITEKITRTFDGGGGVWVSSNLDFDYLTGRSDFKTKCQYSNSYDLTRASYNTYIRRKFKQSKDIDSLKWHETPKFLDSLTEVPRSYTYYGPERYATKYTHKIESKYTQCPDTETSTLCTGDTKETIISNKLIEKESLAQYHLFDAVLNQNAGEPWLISKTFRPVYPPDAEFISQKVVSDVKEKFGNIAPLYMLYSKGSNNDSDTFGECKLSNDGSKSITIKYNPKHDVYTDKDPENIDLGETYFDGTNYKFILINTNTGEERELDFSRNVQGKLVHFNISGDGLTCVFIFVKEDLNELGLHFVNFDTPNNRYVSSIDNSSKTFRSFDWSHDGEILGICWQEQISIYTNQKTTSEISLQKTYTLNDLSINDLYDLSLQDNNIYLMPFGRYSAIMTTEFYDIKIAKEGTSCFFSSRRAASAAHFWRRAYAIPYSHSFALSMLYINRNKRTNTIKCSNYPVLVFNLYNRFFAENCRSTVDLNNIPRPYNAISQLLDTQINGHTATNSLYSQSNHGITQGTYPVIHYNFDINAEGTMVILGKSKLHDADGPRRLYDGNIQHQIGRDTYQLFVNSVEPPMLDIDGNPIDLSTLTEEEREKRLKVYYVFGLYSWETTDLAQRAYPSNKEDKTGWLELMDGGDYVEGYTSPPFTYTALNHILRQQIKLNKNTKTDIYEKPGLWSTNPYLAQPAGLSIISACFMTSVNVDNRVGFSDNDGSIANKKAYTESISLSDDGNTFLINYSFPARQRTYKISDSILEDRLLSRGYGRDPYMNYINSDERIRTADGGRSSMTPGYVDGFGYQARRGIALVYQRQLREGIDQQPEDENYDAWSLIDKPFEKNIHYMRMNNYICIHSIDSTLFCNSRDNRNDANYIHKAFFKAGMQHARLSKNGKVIASAGSLTDFRKLAQMDRMVLHYGLNAYYDTFSENQKTIINSDYWYGTRSFDTSAHGYFEYLGNCLSFQYIPHINDHSNTTLGPWLRPNVTTELDFYDWDFTSNFVINENSEELVIVNSEDKQSDSVPTRIEDLPLTQDPTRIEETEDNITVIQDYVDQTGVRPLVEVRNLSVNYSLIGSSLDLEISWNQLEENQIINANNSISHISVNINGNVVASNLTPTTTNFKHEQDYLNGDVNISVTVHSISNTSAETLYVLSETDIKQQFEDEIRTISLLDTETLKSIEGYSWVPIEDANRLHFGVILSQNVEKFVYESVSIIVEVYDVTDSNNIQQFTVSKDINQLITISSEYNEKILKYLEIRELPSNSFYSVRAKIRFVMEDESVFESDYSNTQQYKTKSLSAISIGIDDLESTATNNTIELAAAIPLVAFNENENVQFILEYRLASSDTGFEAPFIPVNTGFGACNFSEMRTSGSPSRSIRFTQVANLIFPPGKYDFRTYISFSGRIEEKYAYLYDFIIQGRDNTVPYSISEKAFFRDSDRSKDPVMPDLLDNVVDILRIFDLYDIVLLAPDLFDGSISLDPRPSLAILKKAPRSDYLFTAGGFDRSLNAADIYTDSSLMSLQRIDSISYNDGLFFSNNVTKLPHNQIEDPLVRNIYTCELVTSTNSYLPIHIIQYNSGEAGISLQSLETFSSIKASMTSRPRLRAQDGGVYINNNFYQGPVHVNDFETIEQPWEQWLDAGLGKDLIKGNVVHWDNGFFLIETIEPEGIDRTPPNYPIVDLLEDMSSELINAENYQGFNIIKLVLKTTEEDLNNNIFIRYKLEKSKSGSTEYTEIIPIQTEISQSDSEHTMTIFFKIYATEGAVSLRVSTIAQDIFGNTINSRARYLNKFLSRIVTEDFD